MHYGFNLIHTHSSWMLLHRHTSPGASRSFSQNLQLSVEPKGKEIFVWKKGFFYFIKHENECQNNFRFAIIAVRLLRWWWKYKFACSAMYTDKHDTLRTSVLLYLIFNIPQVFAAPMKTTEKWMKELKQRT